jgi:hypothetical protein
MLQEVTVIVGELVCYWVLIMALGLLAAVGWIGYAYANKKLRRITSCPMVAKPNNADVVGKPKEEISN